MTANRVSVIIVAWNSWDVLPACLRAVNAAARRWDGTVEVIVVDNASPDRSGEHVSADFPDVKVLHQSENLGFPRACNIGLAACSGEFVLLLNPDVELDPDVVVACCSRLREDRRLGLVGVRLVDSDGRTQPESARRFPNEWWLLCEALYLHRLLPRTRIFGGLNFGEWNHLEEREVPCLLGAFLMFRGSVLRELGGLDESVFMYFEDIDVCQRVWNGGWRVLYLPDPCAKHIAGTSRAKTGEALSAALDALKGEVAWRFVATHRRPRWRARIITAEIVLYAIIRILVLPVAVLTSDRRRSAREVFRANLTLLAWTLRPKAWPTCA
jgi:GT2 family glycosyltransferase